MKTYYTLLRRAVTIGLSFVIPSFSLATTNGFYVGGQVGRDNLHQGQYISHYLDDLLIRAFPKNSLQYVNSLNAIYQDSGLGGRIFAGYQFNPYFAAEIGYYRFSSLNINTKRDVQLAIFKEMPVHLITHASVKTYAIDVVGKGIIPITEKFSFYGKLGAAYLNAEGNASIAATSIL